MVCRQEAVKLANRPKALLLLLLLLLVINVLPWWYIPISLKRELVSLKIDAALARVPNEVVGLEVGRVSSGVTIVSIVKVKTKHQLQRQLLHIHNLCTGLFRPSNRLVY